jgi:Flp pilus assembly protein TadG
MLEFAIVLPIFLLLVFGIIEMGCVMMLNQVATNASREACRRAVIAGTTQDQVLAIVERYLDDSGVSKTGRVVTITDGAGNPVTVQSIRSHDPVTVTIQFPYSENTLGFTAITGGRNLVSRSTMRRE